MKYFTKLVLLYFHRSKFVDWGFADRAGGRKVCIRLDESLASKVHKEIMLAKKKKHRVGDV